ncbi:FAD-dependent oxidoreductase [Paraburkholderia dipogonis]|uniref:FAD-dependent oxidoreductase n=1 Tax=Paraburkholderia dipogonis TaxID=1211383 RepID=UPI0035EC2C30
MMLAGGARAAVDTEGGFGTDPKIAHELEEMARGVPSGAPWTSPRAAEFDGMSVGDWLAAKNIAPADQIGWSTGLEITGGTAPARLSLLHWLSMVNSAECNYDRLEAVKGGAQETRLSGGSQILSIRMAQALGDKVRLSTPVLRIEHWQNGPVAIHTPERRDPCAQRDRRALADAVQPDRL